MIILIILRGEISLGFQEIRSSNNIAIYQPLILRVTFAKLRELLRFVKRSER